MCDMPLPITPIGWGDKADRCTSCGRALGPRAAVFVAGQSQKQTRGHAVCRNCKPVETEWGGKPHWRSFACERCGRRVHYCYGREYRYCTYRCARTIWTQQATERRSRYRAEHRIKRLTCESCGSTFTATRSDARCCSATCRQRAHRKAGP
jgi:hypothetical protein